LGPRLRCRSGFMWRSYSTLLSYDHWYLDLTKMETMPNPACGREEATPLRLSPIPDVGRAHELPRLRLGLAASVQIRRLTGPSCMFSRSAEFAKLMQASRPGGGRVFISERAERHLVEFC
jgi:hypothetical protein